MANTFNSTRSTHHQAPGSVTGPRSTTQNNPRGSGSATAASGSAAWQLALKSALCKSKNDKKVKFLTVTGKDLAEKLKEEGKFTDLATHLASLPS
jgi:hypothetical protein